MPVIVESTPLVSSTKLKINLGSVFLRIVG